MDIKRIMKEKGITFEMLAEKMGKTKGTLSSSIGKDGNPTLKTLTEIAKHLDCNVGDFFIDNKAINGFIEYDGKVYRIKSVQDIRNLLDLLSMDS